MSCIVRKIFGWGLLILFSAIALLGEALHLLPGLQHEGCALHPEWGEACADCHGTAVADPSSNPSFTAAERDGHFCSSGDCPICQYFAQAKCFVAVEVFACEFLPIYARPTAQSLIFSPQVLCVYQSRGPPACAVPV